MSSGHRVPSATSAFSTRSQTSRLSPKSRCASKAIATWCRRRGAASVDRFLKAIDRLPRRTFVTTPSLRILIVEEELLIRWSIGEVLAEAGHLVVQTADARAALRELTARSGAFDVVLLDLNLPDCQDYGLCRKVRQLAPTAVLVVMTAYGTPELTAEGRRHGAFAVLHKPFDMGGVEPTLRAAYEAAAAARPQGTRS